MKKALLPLLGIFLGLLGHSCSPNQYDIVRKSNLPTLIPDQEVQPLGDIEEQLAHCLRDQINMPALRKRQTALSVLQSAENAKNRPSSILFDTQTANDLNLLSGGKPGAPYLAKQIDYTNTELGKIYLYGLISNPIEDISILKQRQQIIQLLLDNPELLQQVEEIFTQLGRLEGALLSFFNQDPLLTIADRHYFLFESLPNFTQWSNKTPWMLQIRSAMHHNQRISYLALNIGAIVILPIYAACKLCDTQLPESLHKFTDRSQGLLHFLISSKNMAIATGSALLAALYTWLPTAEQYAHVTTNISMDLYIQKKMMLVTKFLREAKKLLKLLAHYPELETICPGARQIKDWFINTIQEDEELNNLLSMLQTDTFKGRASFFSYQGRVLAAFHRLHTIKDKFVPLLAGLAEVDAYRSLAQLYINHQNTPVHFCFAEYQENQNGTPYIAMERFWTLFVDPATVVANSILLGGTERPGMIITGPNAAGKSTFIKTIATNIILAQTIGIVPADSLILTPFYKLGTYLNITDNLGEGHSLFKAQLLRAQQMIKLAESTPSDKVSFIILDELFNGTSAEESKVAAYGLLNYFQQFSNLMPIVATHFPLITTIENHGTMFQNFKVSVDMTNDIIRYPFTVEKGISDSHIALDLLRHEGYDEGILREAERLLAH